MGVIMLKRIITLSCLLLLSTPLLFAGKSTSQYVIKKRQAALDVERSKSEVRQSPLPSNTKNGRNGVQDLNWVFIDSMPNCFGTSNADINPLAYDPYSNTVAMIHRGARSLDTSNTTGGLWYSISTDEGATWERVPSLLNYYSYPVARYPSATISNPFHSIQQNVLMQFSSFHTRNSTLLRLVTLDLGLIPWVQAIPLTGCTKVTTNIVLKQQYGRAMTHKAYIF